MDVPEPVSYTHLAAKQRYQSLGVDIEEVKARLLKVNNLALEGRPEDMVINSHICRGDVYKRQLLMVCLHRLKTAQHS